MTCFNCQQPIDGCGIVYHHKQAVCKVEKREFCSEDCLDTFLEYLAECQLEDIRQN